jgi:hypothetical protein
MNREKVLRFFNNKMEKRKNRREKMENNFGTKVDKKIRIKIGNQILRAEIQKTQKLCET